MLTKEGAIKIAAKKLGITPQAYQARLDAGEKWCSKGKHWQPVSHFNKDSTRGDGLASLCITHSRVAVRKSTKGRVSNFKGRRHTAATRKLLSEQKCGKPNPTRGRRLTTEQRANISRVVRERAVKGAAHPNWKGGITPEHARLRASPEYAAWRTAVFERDGYKCQRCGDSKGGNLNAHHVKDFATHPALRFEVSNGLTLCEDCHKAVHHKPDSLRNLAKARRAGTRLT